MGTSQSGGLIQFSGYSSAGERSFWKREVARSIRVTLTKFAKRGEAWIRRHEDTGYRLSRGANYGSRPSYSQLIMLAWLSGSKHRFCNPEE